jgi:hypothetical protein
MRIPALLAFLLLLSCGREAMSGTALERARQAFDREDFRQAAKLFDEASRTEAGEDDRADAAVRAANLEWRFFGDTAAARARLQRVATANAHLELSRIARNDRDYAAARTEARKAIAGAKDDRKKRRATVALAEAVVRDPKSPAEELKETVASLRGVIESGGALLAPSRLLARAAIRAGDGIAALEGINGYYHVSKFNGPPHVIAASHAVLARLLPGWSGGAHPELANALAGIRFFDEAALLAADSDIARYAAALQRIEALTNEYYRQMALGDEDEDDLRDGVARETRSMPRDREKRFGTYVLIGQTGGHVDLHMGHRVIDRVMPVEQYGRKAQVRFIAIDGVVSNGYSQWMYDDQSGDGGWGTPKEIYQVRPRYADGPLRACALATDPAAREEHEKRIADETARDRAAEGEHPIRYFRGVPLRLRHQYRDAILADLKAKGLTGDALRDAFLARVEKEQFTSSIVLHEGRHAIDLAAGEKHATWELEYRAKLSEIALAPAPREALASVLDHEVGGDSPHGKATEKLARGLAEWMQKHRAAIAGLDATRPVLPQIDTLTDEQIRAAVRSLDPFAAGRM